MIKNIGIISVIVFLAISPKNLERTKNVTFIRINDQY